MRLVPKLRSDVVLSAAIAIGFLVVSLGISTGAQVFFPLHGWLYAADFFALMRDAHTILWGGFGILYAPGIGQTAHPFGALSLVPLAEFSSLMHYVEPYPYPLLRPVIWLWSLGYMSIFLFVYVLAVLRAYRRLGLPESRRRWIAGSSALLAAFCLFPWGHPEDVAAMALSLFAFADLLDDRTTRGAYLAGAAVAFQPQMLLFLMPLALLRLKGFTRLAAFAARAAVIPLAVALPAMAGDWSGSLSGIVSEAQTGKLRFNRPTLWDSLLQFHHGTISASGFRVAMLLMALAVGLVLRWMWRAKLVDARTLLAICTSALALRAFLEPTEVAYYLCPYLALGAISVVGIYRRKRLAAVAWSAFGLGQLGVAMSRVSALSYSLTLWPLALAGVTAVLMSIPPAERGEVIWAGPGRAGGLAQEPDPDGQGALEEVRG